MKLKYIEKRLLIMIPTFFGITILAFFLSSLAPGSPLDLLLANSSITKENIALLEKQYGLDQSIVMQYINWLKELFQGNLGISYRTSEPVLSMVLNRLGPTLLITVSSVVLSIIIAIPLGIMAAVKPYTLWDYISSGLSFVAASTPNFFIALLFVYLFSVKLGMFPTGGMHTSITDPNLPDLIHHMVLPVVVLVFQQIGNLLRQVRGSMLEVLQEDYIRTARAKGLIKRKIIIHHALKNSMIPVVTTIGMNLPFIIGGAVVTEQIFNWPGLGTLMIQSINARDYPCIMGITVFVAVMVLVGNLITDLIYGVLDPRISYK